MKIEPDRVLSAKEAHQQFLAQKIAHYTYESAAHRRIRRSSSPVREIQIDERRSFIVAKPEHALIQEKSGFDTTSITSRFPVINAEVTLSPPVVR